MQTMKGTISDKDIYVRHVIVLISGFIVGLIAAYFFNAIPFDFSEEIRKARDLGIVSWTILAGYPKTKDVLTYITVLCFPVMFSVGMWYIWARNKKAQLGEIFSDDNEVSPPYSTSRTICLLSALLFSLFISFNINALYSAGWNPYVGSWILMGEDGENLAWVQSISSGGVYGKDFFCLYGPMLIYPLAWVMKLFGETIVVERFYKYFLDSIAHFIVIYFLFKTLRWKSTFLFSSIVYLFTFYSLKLSINTTQLRVVLGILPLLLTYMYFGNRKGYLLFLGGVVIGQSLLFSQEVGFCSCVALMATLFVYYFFRSDQRSLLIKHFSWFLLGCLISMTPMVAYLSLKGAFIPFVKSIYGYPKLLMLGYGGLPFPAFKDFIADPAGRYLFSYWPIFFYAFASVYLLTLIILKKINRDEMLKFSLLVFGILLFRIALGRSSDESTYKVFSPAILLLFLFLERSVTAISQRHFLWVSNLIMSILLITVTSVLYMKTDTIKGSFTFAWQDVIRVKYKFSLMNQGYKIPSLKRGGIFYDPATALSIMNIDRFLKVNTKPGEYVYFFPNEAAYYFLFDRENPSRYAISYFAITRAQRQELTEDLEKTKPEYIVYSLGTWRVDNIMEETQVPEVLRYIRTKYALYVNMGDVLILKRSTA